MKKSFVLSGVFAVATILFTVLIINVYNDYNVPENGTEFNDGIYIDDKYYDAGIMEKIKEENFPSESEIKLEYPDKTIITWLLSSNSLFDYVCHFPTNQVNEYLNQQGCDYVVCFKLLEKHDECYLNAVDNLKKEDVQFDILSPSYSLNNEEFENNYHRDAISGLLEPLDEYFSNTIIGNAYYDSMPPEYFDSFRVNGKIYGISGVANNLQGKIGFSIDSELANKYKWDFSKSIVEQITLLKSVKEQENEVCPVYCGNYGEIIYYPNNFDHWYGICWNSDLEKIDAITNDTAYLDILKLLYRLKDENLLSYNEKIDANCFVMLERQNAFSSANGTYTTTMNGKLYTRKYIAETHTYISNVINAIGISAESVYKQEAFDFIIRTQTDPYLNNLLVFGDSTNNSIEDNTVINSQYSVINFYRFGNLSVCYPFDSFPDTINRQYTDIYEHSTICPYLGFAPDISSVKSEYLAIKKTMLTHDYMAYENADLSLRALNEKLIDDGIITLLDELNEQYKDWMGFSQ